MKNTHRFNCASDCVYKKFSGVAMLRCVSFLALMMGFAVPQALANNAGLDTPSGVYTLPIEVEGVPLITLSVPAGAVSASTVGTIQINGQLSLSVNAPAEWAASFINTPGATNTYGVYTNGIILSYVAASNTNWAGIFQNMGGPYGLYTSNNQGIYSQLANAGYGLYTNGAINVSGTAVIGGTATIGGATSIGGSLSVTGGDVTIANGGIQVGNTGNCTPGMIRWDGSQYWGCNASATWATFGGSHPQHTEDVSTTTNNAGAPGNTVWSGAVHDMCVLSSFYRVHDSGNGYMSNCTVSGSPTAKWSLNVFGVAEQVSCTMSCYDF